MKPLLTSLALLGLALASQAQPLPGTAPQGAFRDSGGLQGVASPNRTASMALANADKSARNRRADKDGKVSTDAIVWVDATGRTVGRAINTNAMLLTYDGQPAILTGLEVDQACDAGGACSYASGGNRWSSYFSVYYTSPDCAGTPYLPYGGFGTPYVGVPVVDAGATYIYLLKVTETVRVSAGSSYTNNTCHSIRGGELPLDAAPVSAVVPASTFGRPPYFLK